MKRIAVASWTWFDTFYARFAKVLLIFCLLAATGGVIIGTTAQVKSGKATEANAALTQCLEDWSAENSRVSKATRKAAEAKDDAVTVFNSTLADEGQAFLDLITAIIQQDSSQHEYDLLIQHLERTLRARADSNQVVVDAQNKLDSVRAKNPVPPPPAEFCHLGEE